MDSLANLQKLITKHLYAVIISLAVGATATWQISEHVIVAPLERTVSNQKDEIAQLKLAQKDFEAAIAPYKSKEDQSNRRIQELEISLQAERNNTESCKNMNHAWENQSVGLQNANSQFARNCSIIQSINAINSQKSAVDSKLIRYSDSYNYEKEKAIWLRESDHYQQQAIEMAKHLNCEKQ